MRSSAKPASAIGGARREFDCLAICTLFLAPMLFYWWTMTPTMGVGDSAMMLGSIADLNVSSHVNNHPFTVLVGWLFHKIVSTADFAYRGNLSSAFLGAVAIGVFGILVKRATTSWPIALLSSAALAVSHSQWWHSTIVECYALNALFTGLYLLALDNVRLKKRKRDIGVLFLVCSLALFNHVQMAFFSVGAGVVLLLSIYRLSSWKSRAAYIGIATLAYAVGLIPWLVLLIRDALRFHSFTQALSGAFFGSFKHIMLEGSVFYGIARVINLVLLQFPSPFIIAIVGGLWCLRKRPGILVPLLLTIWFFHRYNTWDRFAFLLPAFVILAYGAALFIARAWEAIKARGRASSPTQRRLGQGAIICLGALSVIMPPWIYSQLHKWESMGRQYSDFYTANSHRLGVFLANPNRRDYRDIDTYIRALFEALPKNAVYFDDDSRLFYPVQFYQKRYNLRRDIKPRMINSWGDDDGEMKIKNWGLDKQGFRNQLRSALNRGTPTFMITTGNPFAKWVEDFRDEFAFEKFPLNSKQWIYKLVPPRSDQPTKRLDSGQIQTERNISASDLHVPSSSKASVTRQAMAEFGPYWLDDDQTLVEFPNNNASFSIDVDALEDTEGTLTVFSTTAADYARVSISADGGPSEEIPSYSRFPLRIGTKILVTLKKGKNTFSITASDVSKGKKWGIDSIKFEPLPTK